MRAFTSVLALSQKLLPRFAGQNDRPPISIQELQFRLKDSIQYAQLLEGAQNTAIDNSAVHELIEMTETIITQLRRIELSVEPQSASHKIPVVRRTLSRKRRRPPEEPVAVKIARRLLHQGASAETAAAKTCLPLNVVARLILSGQPSASSSVGPASDGTVIERTQVLL
jgi:hypothetical protein